MSNGAFSSPMQCTVEYLFLPLDPLPLSGDESGGDGFWEGCAMVYIVVRGSISCYIIFVVVDHEE